MSRQQTANTFTEGMIMDLNPITTPNNVLTNALNATLITYNGNEFVLQNDMGNGRVETAYLPAGYVPVGIKEYGGIIYVASYNPITNKAQIGSFPSPERNISSSEIESGDSPIISPEVFNLSGGTGTSQFVYKLKLFKKDSGTIIRSGDKFSILLTSQASISTLKGFVSNCLNTTGSKVSSPKNKLLTITVAVIDSNNNLRDITEQLKRFDTSNTVIDFDAAESPIFKLNSGYYMQTFQPGGDVDVDNFRQKRAVNTYNNKVFGELYIITQLNTIESIDVSVRGYKNEDGKEIEVDGQKFSDKGSLLVFDVNYKYNCPDGVYDDKFGKLNSASEEFKETYASYYGNVSDYSPNQTIHGIRFDTTLTDGARSTATYDLPFLVESDKEETYPVFNIESKIYSKDQSAYLMLKDKLSGILNYEATPYMKYSALSGLKVSSSIDIGKLGTGLMSISRWKSYCNPTSINLTWGLNAYPLTGTAIDNVTFYFYDILQPTVAPDKYDKIYQVPRKRSYNGVFTESFSFDDTFKEGKLYLVRVCCTIDKEGYEKTIGYRWLYTTPLYNQKYFLEDDFYTMDNIEELNKVILKTVSESSPVADPQNIQMYDSSPVSNTEKTFNVKKATTSVLNYTLSGETEIENSNYYPFTLLTNNIVTKYSLGDITFTLGNIRFYGDETPFTEVFIDNPDNVIKVDSIDENNNSKHQYSIIQTNSNIKIETRMLSQLVGKSFVAPIAINYLFEPFITKDNFKDIFGYAYNNGGNNTLGAIASSYISIGVRKKSSGTDGNWWAAFNIRRSSHTSDFAENRIIELEYKKGGDQKRYMTQYWEDFKTAIKDYYGDLPIFVIGSTGFYNGVIDFPAGVGGHYTTAARDLVGSSDLPRFQYILWNTGGDLNIVNKFIYYNNSNNLYEMPEILYQAYKDIYFYKGEQMAKSLYVLDSNNYCYNDDYQSTIDIKVTDSKTINGNIFVADGVPYETRMSSNVTSLINGIEANSEEPLEESVKAEVINTLKKLATFTVEEDSLENEIVITATVPTSSMTSTYSTMTSISQTGIQSAIVVSEDSGAIYLIDEDKNGAVLDNKTIYYVYSQGGTYKAEVATNVASTAYERVKNLKIGKLGGKMTLLSNGNASKRTKNFWNKAGDYCELYYKDLPVIDINYPWSSNTASIAN